MTDTYRPIPTEDVLSGMAPERQARIKARAAELIAEEMALRDLRRAKHVTQEQVAQRLGGRQVYVSRLEKRADMKLSTLREYVRAIGGDLQLMVTFPEDKAVRLKDIGEGSPRQRRQVTSKAKTSARARQSQTG
jgi:transcriptional regulator with XRE-family HTH domain